MQIGAVLVDDLAPAVRARADRGPLDVVVGIVGELLVLVAGDVVAPEVEPMRRARIRQVVERLAVPHGQRVGPLPVGDLARRVLGQVEEPDVGGHAAAVALPGAMVPRVRGVGEPLAVGADRAYATVGHRQLAVQTATRRHGEELLRARVVVHASREVDQPIVGRPAGEDLGHGVVRHPERHAPGRGHGVEIAVAGVVAHERDGRAVRAELGIALLARRAGQRRRDAALARHQPQVVGIEEHDVRGTDVGVAEHARVRL